jgi:hypothetical protein
VPLGGEHSRLEPPEQARPAVQVAALGHDRLRHGVETNIAAEPGIALVKLLLRLVGNCCLLIHLTTFLSYDADEE